MLISLLAFLGTVSGAPLEVRQNGDPCSALIGVGGCEFLPSIQVLANS
jgi:hypothetical protein